MKPWSSGYSSEVMWFVVCKVLEYICLFKLVSHVGTNIHESFFQLCKISRKMIHLMSGREQRKKNLTVSQMYYSGTTFFSLSQAHIYKQISFFIFLDTGNVKILALTVTGCG